MRPRRLAVAALLGLGFWQFAHGSYIPAKAWLAQELMQRAWSRTSTDVHRVHPWPWADTWPVARLTAKEGSVDLIVLAGGSGRTLAFGPGHLGASALPGERGNTVIAGHRDTHFRFLQSLRTGETLELQTATGLRYRYQVVEAAVVDSRAAAIALESDLDVLSLVTCFPFDAVDPGGPMRYVVTAIRDD